MEEPYKGYIVRPVEELHNPASKLNIKPRTENNFFYYPHIVYAEAYGVGLFMDVFLPKEEINGFGIIDIVANGWFSDRHQFVQHVGIGVYDVLCKQGYTVFAVSPGSVQIFSAKQMIKNVQSAIRFVITNANKFKISPNSLGIIGISAGGHLATCSLYLTFELVSNTVVKKYSEFNAIRCMALYAVPFDLLALYQKSKIPELSRILTRLVRRKGFYEEEASIPSDQIEERLKEISPYYFELSGIKSPPYTLIFHGIKDEIVPYSQSEKFAEKLNIQNWKHELIIKDNAPHIWPNMRIDFEYMGRKFYQEFKEQPEI
ncbi:MAG: prolyl oligopeptidase family serine peptidase [Candidatus Hydrogenedentes bacterium]|nr:prolyl oligopeptidase family serine peptidase [Candidatus Hydrogenedentota bacterium]